MSYPLVDSISYQPYSKKQKLYFLFIAFGIGLFITAIEKATSRLLTTHLGSTIHTDTGLVCGLMLCLAIGYYLGGCVAMKHATPTLLYSIILTVGAYTGLLAGWATSGVRLVTSCVTIHPFHIFLASWVSTLLLLVLPLVCIGIIISFIIQLSTYYSIEKTGKTIGKIIAWTTVGSILGGILSTFLTLPYLGIVKTILYSGLWLLIIGIVGFLPIYLYSTKAVKVK